MDKRHIVLERPRGGPYSHVVRAGGLAFLSGQVPVRPDGTRVDGSFEEQARQALANVQALAEAVGCTLADAVRVGVYLRDMDDFPAMNELYSEFFSEPYPARTTIQSDIAYAIEVDAVLVDRAG